MENFVVHPLLWLAFFAALVAMVRGSVRWLSAAVALALASFIIHAAIDQSVYPPVFWHWRW
jgi:hypothetical protein